MEELFEIIFWQEEDGKEETGRACIDTDDISSFVERADGRVGIFNYHDELLFIVDETYDCFKKRLEEYGRRIYAAKKEWLKECNNGGK